MKTLAHLKANIVPVAIGAAILGSVIVIVSQPRLNLVATSAVAPSPVEAATAIPVSSVALHPVAISTVTLAPQHPARVAEPDLASVFPAPQLPYVVNANVAAIALNCLQKNGADLSKPMPSTHTVFAANAEIASRLASWARSHGFEVRGPEMVRDHVGTPRFHLDFIRVEVPIPQQIESEGRLVLDAVQQNPGSYYQTWSGGIVR